VVESTYAMKAGLFLLLALGSSSTSACSHYDFCHCQDSDGSFDNAATGTVCGWYGSGLGQMVYATHNYGPDTKNEECAVVASVWDNCKWRKHCKDAGATGDDSSCWCKSNCDNNPPYETPVSTASGSVAVATSPINGRIPVRDAGKVN
jgi:hypothetical protein